MNNKPYPAAVSEFCRQKLSVYLLFWVVLLCSMDFGCIAVGSLIGLFSHHPSSRDAPSLPCCGAVATAVEMGFWKPYQPLLGEIGSWATSQV
ncbi:hypothetical protein V6N12_012881 [Hibiscus sabdariffa]|uniref:Uncharacterized protein n=1 Tax=Hibiscus sabdariffa TaxID=183260 RepID=A0ABR2EFP4_9ROSI